MKRKFIQIVTIFAFALFLAIVQLNHYSTAQEVYQLKSAFKIGRLKYRGGGDWYNDPSSEINLLKFIRENTNIDVIPVYEFVDIASDNIFSYPFLFMTGHGNISFNEEEARRLRTYLENGGFLYADDDYGMDKSFRREIKKVFPDKELVELPFHMDFSIVISISQMELQKHMNTTINPRRHLEFSIMVDSSFFTLMNQTQVMAGLIPKFTTTLKKKGKKH